MSNPTSNTPPNGRAARRTFFQAAAGAVVAACSKAPPTKPQPGAPKEGDPSVTVAANAANAAMPTRVLGRTNQTVSLIGIGGFHIGLASSDDEATRIVRSAIDRGVTFLDNCWDYNGGKSEVRMGNALQNGYRDKVFLMTKLDGRTKESAMGQLEQSLQRLKTDHIDLVQVHEVIRMTDPERVFGAGGAMEALLEAKKAGKIRFIGFTGHKDPDIHLHMIKKAEESGFTFDTVQMPINVMDPHYRSFIKNVLPVAKAKNMGVLGMKPMGSGIILKAKVATAPECLRFAMTTSPGIVITGCETMGILDQAIKAAIEFKPMTDAEANELLVRTASTGAEGIYEEFKTKQTFDGTAQNPKWLEEAKI